MNMETVREFLGWCAVINIGILLFTSILIMALGRAMSKFHAKLFGLDQADIMRAYFQYIANLKIAVIIFALVPYVALSIMD